MQFELTITPDDVHVLLAEIVLSKKRFMIKQKETDVLENCTALDFNEKTKYVDIVCLTDQEVVKKEVAVYSIERIEFYGFHTYRGYKAKSFVLE